MNDYGTDAEAFSSTMEFLLNGPMSNNGVCPIDLDLNVNRGSQGLEIVDFDPKVEDTDSSDDERGDELKMHLRQACGDFSNAKIEERWIDSSSSDKSTKAGNKPLRRQYDELRAQTISSIPMSTVVQADPVVEPEGQRQKPKSSRRHRPKFKNVAIESILEIKGISTDAPATVATVAETEQVNLRAVFPSSMPNTVNTNGLNPRARGRGRPIPEKGRRNISMIRPECINGYNANPDYDPNNPLGTLPVGRDEFPPL